MTTTLELSSQAKEQSFALIMPLGAEEALLEAVGGKGASLARLAQAGLRGLWTRKRRQRTKPAAANPMGAPGWPELAFWIASMARPRIVLMHISSRVHWCDDGSAVI